MPVVGNKKFPYTKKGIAAARKAMKKYAHGGVINYDQGGKNRENTKSGQDPENVNDLLKALKSHSGKSDESRIQNLKDGKLLGSEHPDTWLPERVDLDDILERIQFIHETVNNEGRDRPNNEEKADIYALERYAEMLGLEKTTAYNSGGRVVKYDQGGKAPSNAPSKRAQKLLNDVINSLHSSAERYGRDSDPASMPFEILSNEFNLFTSAGGKGTHLESSNESDAADYEYIVRQLSKVIADNYSDVYDGPDTEQKFLDSYLDDGSGMNPTDGQYDQGGKTPMTSPEKNTVKRLLEELSKHSKRVDEGIYADDAEAKTMFERNVSQYPTPHTGSLDESYYDNVKTDSQGNKYMYQDDGNTGVIIDSDGNAFEYPRNEVIERSETFNSGGKIIKYDQGGKAPEVKKLLDILNRSNRPRAMHDLTKSFRDLGFDSSEAAVSALAKLKRINNRKNTPAVSSSDRGVKKYAKGGPVVDDLEDTLGKDAESVLKKTNDMIRDRQAQAAAAAAEAEADESPSTEANPLGAELETNEEGKVGDLLKKLEGDDAFRNVDDLLSGLEDIDSSEEAPKEKGGMAKKLGALIGKFRSGYSRHTRSEPGYRRAKGSMKSYDKGGKTGKKNPHPAMRPPYKVPVGPRTGATTLSKIFEKTIKR